MSMKKIRSNVLQQNCYVRDIRDAKSDISSNIVPEYYYDVVTVTSEDGSQREDIVVQPYPYSAESVASYSDGIHYWQCGLDAPRTSKKNLGDITGIQKLLNNFDSATLRQFYNSLKDKFSQSQSEKGKTADSENSSGDDKNEKL
ncbi:hypothetical protein [Dipodfec virus UA23Rod_1125]|uniref:Uncharacterized protein n=1 Tax=Dipodfec virus UA23Rod_1125 TaxID=2929328 RepID=A0A976R5F5_9VIRU|nr:hypothetical protein [Dipodfec virus UA23Rod_1125]